MNKTIPVELLKVGMEVVALDKSWLETNILFHRFRIRSTDEIDKLRENGIQMVTVNISSEPLPGQETLPEEPGTSNGTTVNKGAETKLPLTFHQLEVVSVPDLRDWNALHNKTIGLLEKASTMSAWGMFWMPNPCNIR